jgi:hypothetical protein
MLISAKAGLGLIHTLGLKHPVDREFLDHRMADHREYTAMEHRENACDTSIVDVSAILIASSPGGSVAEHRGERVLGAIAVHYGLILVIGIL